MGAVGPVRPARHFRFVVDHPPPTGAGLFQQPGIHCVAIPGAGSGVGEHPGDGLGPLFTPGCWVALTAGASTVVTTVNCETE